MSGALARLMEQVGAESKAAEEAAARGRGASQEGGAIREGGAVREGEEAAAGARARSNAIANEAEALSRQTVLRDEAKAAERTEINKAVEEARAERLKEVNRARENPAAAKDAAADAKEQKSLGARAWENIKTFAKWAGNQIVQAVIIILVMDQVEKVLEKMGMVGKPADGAKPSESGSGSNSTAGTSTNTTDTSNSEAAKVLDFFKTLNSCDKKTLNTVTEWVQWMTDHLEHKNDYGSFTAEGEEVFYFVSFQTKVMDLGIWHTENVVPALETVLTAKTVASVKSMIEKSLEYTKKVKVVADRIKEKYTLMTAADLKDHVDELAGTISTLDSESKK